MITYCSVHRFAMGANAALPSARPPTTWKTYARRPATRLPINSHAVPSPRRADSALRMGDHFDLVADLCGLPRPERITREQAVARLSPLQASFLGESRRLDNRRLKRELRVALRYPTVADALGGRA